MVYQISHHNCDLSPRSRKIVTRETQKIARFLPSLSGDLPNISLFIEWNPRRKFFGGWIDLSLPRKVLRAKINGTDMEISINNAFKGLIRELTKYESLHMRGNSQYPKHESIRFAVNGKL